MTSHGMVAGLAVLLASVQGPPVRDARTGPPPSAQATAMIAGRLVAADTGRPVRQARVTIAGMDVRFTRGAVTDDQGAFSFSDLPAGQFTLSASKGGFLDVAYGQKRPGTGRPGTPIQLQAGEKLDRITLDIPRASVITGTILDDFGDPVFGLQVRAMRYVRRTGERTLQVAGTGMTDDRGVYRISGLLPGDYVVTTAPRDPLGLAITEEMKVRAAAVLDAASARGNLNEGLVMEAKAMAAAAEQGGEDLTTGLAPVFYPGTPQLSAATTIPIGVSEERQNVDLRLQYVRLARVSGMVASTGPVPPGAQVFLFDSAAAVPGAGNRSARVMPDGRFTFAGIPPGQYTLFARASVRPQSTEWATPAAIRPESKEAAIAAALAPQPTDILWSTTEIAVNGDPVTNVALMLQPGMAVTGTVVFDAAPSGSVDFSRLRLTLVPVGGALGAEFAVTREAPVDAAGRFTIRGAIPGRYRVVPGSGVPSGFTIESAVFGGRDVLDFPLEIASGQDQSGGVLTFSTRVTELSGTVSGAGGKPVADLTIVAFPADARYWLPQNRRIQASRPATDGRFSFRYLPPGDYRLVAVADPEPGQWFDPEFLKQLVAGSIAVSLGPGEKKRQDVTLASGGGPSIR